MIQNVWEEAMMAKVTPECNSNGIVAMGSEATFCQTRFSSYNNKAPFT